MCINRKFSRASRSVTKQQEKQQYQENRQQKTRPETWRPANQ